MMLAVDLFSGMVLCTAASGCADLTEAALPPPSITVTSSGDCVRVIFQINSPTSVTGTYPANSCPTVGLIVAKPGAMTWDGTTRILTIPMMVRNTTAETIQLPLRLELPVDGKVVINPAGTPKSKLVPLNMDSTLALDRKVWLFGAAGTLAPGDSTAPRNLTFRIDSPVTRGRFMFVSQGEEITGTVPMLAPDSTPTWFAHDSSYSLPGKRGILKGVIAIVFQPATPLAARQQAVDQVGGDVIGGFRGPLAEGTYYLRIADDGSGSQLLNAISLLKQLPQIAVAGPKGQLVPFLRRPNDGQGWTISDWSLGPAQAGRNWLFEEIGATLAWGCEVGTASTHVAMIDHDFASTSDLLANLANPATSVFNDPLDSSDHGYVTTRLVGAVGDNGIGTSGVMQKAGLSLYDINVSPGGSLDAERVAAKLLEAGRAGASVVVLAWGWDGVGLSPQLDSAVAVATKDEIGRAMATLMSEGWSPLLVLAAGNRHRDTWFTGVTQLRDTYSSSVLVVGGTDRSQTPASSDRDAHPLYAFGTRIDVWAPAAEDTLPNADGLIFSYSGTSISAPLAGGVAGLLKAFDPSLSAGALKQLIVDGAEAGFGGLGIILGGGGSSGKLLNAYESLKLAAKKSGTPICGNDVGIDATGALVAVRGSGVEQIAPPGSVVWRVSVAQGGRLVAGTSDAAGPDPVVRTYSLQGGVWQAGPQSAAGVYAVQYLERDTAILKLKTLGTYQVGGPVTLTITGPSGGAVQDLDLGTRVGAANSVFRLVKVSPDAQWVGFMSQRQGGNYYYADSIAGGHLITLRSTPAQAGCPFFNQVFGPGTSCTDAPYTADDGDLNWDPAGGWAGLLDRTFTAVCPIGASCLPTRKLYAVRFDRATRSVLQVQDDTTWAFSSLLSGDGLVWRECRYYYDPQTFTSTARTATRSPTTLATVSSVADCLPLQRPTLQNTPVALARGARRADP